MKIIGNFLKLEDIKSEMIFNYDDGEPKFFWNKYYCIKGFYITKYNYMFLSSSEKTGIIKCIWIGENGK